MIDDALRRLARWKWTDVYGLARSVIALSTLMTLALHQPEHLFAPIEGLGAGRLQSGAVDQFSLFEIVPDTHLGATRWLAVCGLALVVVGWRPRITGVLHWWISFSFVVSGVPIDGGDHAAASLTLLLVPITLTDGRRWHWETDREPTADTGSLAAGLVARSAHLMIRLQVAIIYLHAAVAKLGVEEWVNGTAAYYWFLHPTHGVGDWLRPAVESMVASRIWVVVFTWGALAIEFGLASGLFMKERYRRIALVVGIGFHALIAVVHGLVTFSITMTGALILYLAPVTRDIHVAERVGRTLSRIRGVFAGHISTRDLRGRRSSARGT